MTLQECYKMIIHRIRPRDMPKFVEVPAAEWLNIRKELEAELAKKDRALLSADIDRPNFLIANIPVVSS